MDDPSTQSPFKAGYDAGFLMRGEAMNPHGMTTDEHKLWRWGWITGMFHQIYYNKPDLELSKLHNVWFGFIPRP